MIAFHRTIKQLLFFCCKQDVVLWGGFFKYLCRFFFCFFLSVAMVVICYRISFSLYWLVGLCLVLVPMPSY
jgi:hypothetical protein